MGRISEVCQLFPACVQKMKQQHVKGEHEHIHVLRRFERSVVHSLTRRHSSLLIAQLTLSTRRHGDASATVIPSLQKYTISKSNILTWINAAVQLVEGGYVEQGFSFCCFICEKE